MINVLILLYIIANVVFNIYEYSRRYISAGLLVSLGQLLMFTGIVKLVDFGNEADVVLLIIYFLGYIIFAFIYQILIHGYTFSDVKYNAVMEKKQYQVKVLYWMIVFSILVSFIFFSLSGVNIIQTIMEAIIHRSGTDISQLRKAITFTRGSGVVYQLRNFILPLSVMYFVIFEKGNKRTFGIAILPIMIILLIGSGQRAGLVFLSVIIIVSILLGIKVGKNNQQMESNKYARNLKRKLYITVGLLSITFVTLTLLNGRDQVSGTLIKAIEDRFINDNQACAILAFRYIYYKRISFGVDWLNMFMDLFRENQYTPVSALIHGQLYGSLQGTSPPCIWGSAYYNFGYLGVLLISFFLAFMSKTLYVNLCKKENNRLRLLLYAGMFVMFATWLADSPIMLLNGGFLTIVLMYIVLFSKFRIQLKS